MLKANIIKTAVESAHAFPNLSALSSTPLSHLVATSCDLTGLSKFESVNQHLETVSADKTGGVAFDHSEAFRSVKARYLDSVRATVKTANAMVLPKVRSIAESVAIKQASIKDQAFDLIKVRIVAANPAYLLPELDLLVPDTLATRTELPNDADKVIRYLAGLDSEEVLRLCETGVAPIDAMLPELTKNISFTGIHGSFSHLSMSDAERYLLDASPLVVILAINGMLNGNLGEIGNEQRKIANDVRAFAVDLHRTRMRRVIDGLSRGRLVWGITNDAVFVEKVAYQKYLSDGGHMEALMAYACHAENKSPYANVPKETILTSHETLMDVYRRKVTTARLQKDLDLVAATEGCVRAEVASLASGENGMTPQEIAAWFKDNPYSKAIQLDEYILNCVLDVFRYEGTQVGRFIRTKQSVAVSLEGSDVTAADITTAAILTIVAESLATQVSVVAPSDDVTSPTFSLESYYGNN